MRHVVLFALLALSLLATRALAAELPLVFSENFEQGADPRGIRSESGGLPLHLDLVAALFVDALEQAISSEKR